MNSDDTTSSTQEKFKIVMLGDMGVGKSSIVERLIFDRFDEGKNVLVSLIQQPTTFIDLMSKKILHHKKLLLLNFWDTAGQERYRSMALSSIKNCHLAIIVYDVTLSSTLKNCDEWWQILQENKPCDASVILVGNKTDLQGKKSLREEAVKWALEHSISFCEVSAKTGSGMQNLLNQILNSSDFKFNPDMHSKEKLIEKKTKIRVPTIAVSKPKSTCCSI